MMLKKVKDKKLGRQIGVALSISLAVIILLFLIGFALLRLGLSARIQSIRATSQIAARTAADSGFLQALRGMRTKLDQGGFWDNNDLPQASGVSLPNCSETYTYDVNGEPVNGFLITSIGCSGAAEKIVYGKLEIRTAFFGIGVKETIDAKNSAGFGTFPAGDELVIQTNSTASGAITLKSGVVIPGDVVVGPGGDPCEVISAFGGAVITGDCYAADEPIYFPPVYPPDLPLIDNNFRVKSETVTINESGRYGNIRLSAASDPGVLEIDGDVTLYVTGDFLIDSGCELIITEDSSLKLYIDGSLIAKNASSITSIDQDPTKLRVYGTETCDSIDIRTKGDFYGAIYAQNADLVLHNEGDLYGGFVGNSLEMKNSSGFFYYATALSQIGIDDDTAYFEVKRWWEE